MFKLAPAFLAAFTVAVTSATAAPAAVAPIPQPQAVEVSPQAKNVLAISVDGLNPSAIGRLGPERAPTFHRLMAEGSFTLNARSSVEQTVTLPNHTGMLTSRRIAKSAGGHGVTFNEVRSTTVHRTAGSYVSSVFDVVHDRGGSTALYSAKDKFEIFHRTWGERGRADRFGRNQGRDKVDTSVILNQREAELTNQVARSMATNPATFTFWHIGQLDATGHDSGWLSPAYMDAVALTDARLGKVLANVDTSSTVVVLTADHGGIAGTKSHSNVTKRANYRVPFMVWGADVPAQRNLYSINPKFARPGKAQLSYDEKQPIRNSMVGNFATDLLGMPAIPRSELNSLQRLQARR